MKNFESPEAIIKYQLSEEYAQIGQAVNELVSTLEKARKGSLDLLPEKRKPYIQEKIRAHIEKIGPTLASAQSNVDARHMRVATSLSERAQKAKPEKSEIRELIDLQRSAEQKKEIMGLNSEDRMKVFYKALREKDDLIVDIFRNSLQPMVQELILNSELTEYDTAKLEAIAPGEPALLETLSDARSAMKRSAEIVRENVIAELAKDQIIPQDFSPVRGMTDAEKAAYVDQHGLESFKRLCDGF
jgi:hypothetical protein